MVAEKSSQSQKVIRAIVSGRVQGVGFRWYVAARAKEYGVQGYAKNLYDGTVEVYLQGETLAVETVLAGVRLGPRWARVAQVEVKTAPEIEVSGFRIY